MFSEAVNLHPVAIIVAILVFGGLWGLWGVFFAIPLATLVQAIISAWPTVEALEREAGKLKLTEAGSQVLNAVHRMTLLALLTSLFFRTQTKRKVCRAPGYKLP